MMCPEFQKALDSIKLNIKPQSGKAIEVERKEVADMVIQILTEGIEEIAKRKKKWSHKA